LRVEASGVKLFGKRLMFEVDGDISEICRSGKAAGFEELALPLLRSGVVDLEDAKMRVRVAVSEGVEARTEKNILRNAMVDGVSEGVFGVTAAGDEEGAKADGERTVRTGGSAAKFFGVSDAEYGDRDGVVENERFRVVDLVRCTTQSHAKCSSGWAGVLHDERR
jgi:hypothetical protein